MAGLGRKEWLLLLASGGLTLALALIAIRSFAPGLLGIALDRQIVQLDKQVPAFYDGVFRMDGFVPEKPLVPDPLTGHRFPVAIPENGKQWAPYDLLGFRNRRIPSVADVVTLGDSQTFGLNVAIHRNWPYSLQARLANKRGVVYDMSAEGWGPVQYMYMFEKAMFFHPRVVVVAFYTGNDARDAAHMVYSMNPWAELRQFPRLPKLPPSAWPPKPEDIWQVTLGDGRRVSLTPKLRLSANDRDFAAIPEGYRLMGEAARRMDQVAGEQGVHVVFTVLPTKETTYATLFEADGITPPPAYTKLVDHEAQSTSELAQVISTLAHSSYVDVVTPLQAATLRGEQLYPLGPDGHPREPGYQVIAGAIAEVVAPLIPALLSPGLIGIEDEGASGPGKLALIRYGGVFRFSTPQVMLDSGWDINSPVSLVRRRDLATLPDLGVILEPDPARWGPRADGT